ncbi:MAG: hypothetical protein LUD68_03670 [Rikenellaceae bacterium]|nr:hypothetical protein [Rikenellaceae bacterium]
MLRGGEKSFKRKEFSARDEEFPKETIFRLPAGAQACLKAPAGKRKMVSSQGKVVPGRKPGTKVFGVAFFKKRRFCGAFLKSASSEQ